jgi:hypothetical protein
MGPFKVISTFSHYNQWADSCVSAVPLSSKDKSIQGHWQCSFSSETIGPFKIIDNFSHLCEWAHSRASAAFLMGDNRPIQGHQHFLSFAALANSWVSSVILMRQDGPNQGHQQHFLMGNNVPI